MTRSTRLARLVTTGVAAAALTAGLAAESVHAGPEGPDVPSEIQVRAGNKVFLVGHAVGVQIYSCRAGSNGLRWGLVAPRADLYGDNGQLIATHFGGPTWEARDGSSIVGKRVDGVSVDPTAIQWLLLSATPTATGPDSDRLTATTFIQRTETTGGLEPAAAECNAQTVGTTVEIPYTADYHFWKSDEG